MLLSRKGFVVVTTIGTAASKQSLSGISVEVLCCIRDNTTLVPESDRGILERKKASAVAL